MLKRGGFSFVELILTIAVIGIMAAIVLPRLSNNTQGTLDTQKAAHLLAADLRYTRRLAITKKESYRLQFFSTTPITYKILRDANNSQVDDTREIPSTVTKSGDFLVIFLASGKTINDRAITLSGPNTTYNVLVFSQTGGVQLKQP